MGDRRSRLEIYVEILTEIKNGVNIPTRIMYKTNLSWKPVSQMLQYLEKQRLIENCFEKSVDHRSNKDYHITEKGDNVLQHFNRIKNLLVINDAALN